MSKIAGAKEKKFFANFEKLSKKSKNEAADFITFLEVKKNV